MAGAAGFHAEKSSDDHIRNESGDHPDADYIVLDLETTGFSPKTCGIIDIGIVYVKNDESIGEYSQLINPGILIPPEITNLTGVDDDMLKEQPRIVDVIHELRRRIGDLPILGHNIQFDIGFLNQAFQDAGLPQPRQRDLRHCGTQSGEIPDCHQPHPPRRHATHRHQQNRGTPSARRCQRHPGMLQETQSHHGTPTSQ